MRKKILVFTFFLHFFLFNCYSFPVDDYYRVRSPGEIIKIKDNIGMLFNNTYQIRNIKEYNIDEDGWFNTSYCGTNMYIIFGSNYFVYHSDKDLYYPESASKFNFGSSYLSLEEYQKYIKNSGSWILWRNASMKIPDVLEEYSNDKKITYDDFDATHYFYFCNEIDAQLFKYNSLPWATSKNPINMKIEVNLFDKTDSFIILNGYVHPDKRYLYKANRRLKKIKISSLDSDFSIINEFEDVVHFHEIKLPEKVQFITIEILDYYEGNKYQDLCVQMIGNKNIVYEDRKEFLDFNDLSYNGSYNEYQIK
ncbi:MAG: hypothetical protein IK024_02635 [Treponema sp.]|nr:hypothetical protein [Treponema sp.]